MHASRGPTETPERLFDRRWAALALDRALQRLRREYILSSDTRRSRTLCCRT
jgi:hypothetical protein